MQGIHFLFGILQLQDKPVLSYSFYEQAGNVNRVSRNLFALPQIPLLHISIQTSAEGDK